MRQRLLNVSPHCSSDNAISLYTQYQRCSQRERKTVVTCVFWFEVGEPHDTSTRRLEIVHYATCG